MGLLFLTSIWDPLLCKLLPTTQADLQFCPEATDAHTTLSLDQLPLLGLAGDVLLSTT